MGDDEKYLFLRDGCICGIQVFDKSADMASVCAVYCDLCPVHNEAWRREYLGLPT